MKKNLIIILLCLLYNIVESQNLITNNNGDQLLYGTTSIEDLTQEPFKEWFIENQKEYTSTLTKEEGALLKDVKIKAFFGTWCGDTRYLLPKFLKASKSMGLDESQIELIALHVDSTLYKQGPNKETDDYAIHKVPTFVFEKNGEEIGRIVERTVFDLDTDLRLIAEGKPYKHRYKGINILDDYLKTVEADSMLTKTTINQAYQKIRRESPKASVLNTYGYMLKYQGKIDQAKTVFKLNKLMFPYEPNTRDSYAEILMETNELEEAKEEYYEALRLLKEDEHIVKKLAELSKLLEEKSTD